MNRLGLTLIFTVGLAAAFAAPAGAGTACVDATSNLRARVVSPLATSRRPFDHRRRARVAVEIANDGDCTAQARVALKGLLLPSNDTIQHGEHSHPSGAGAVLPTRWIDADIPEGEARTWVIDEALPTLSYQAYRLAVVVDASHVIGERDELDNITHLVDAGFLSVEQRTFAEPDGDIDLAADLRSALVKQQGGVAHTLGLSARPYPQESIPSEDLYVRFLLASTRTNEVYTLIYDHNTYCVPNCPDGYTCNVAQSICEDADGNSAPMIDKQYYALAWNPENDPLGRAVGTDYYWQAPAFTDAAGAAYVPPGDYRFLVVTDTHDLIRELDEGNNLYATPFTLAPIELVGVPNTWFVSTPLGDEPPPVSVPVLNSYAAQLSYNVEVPAEAAAWLQVTPTSGAFNLDQSRVLTFSVTRGALAPGKYTADVAVHAAGYEGYPLTIPVSLYVYDAEVPEIEVSPANLDFATEMGVHPAPKSFVVTNSGNLDLDWEAWPTVEWISVASTTGSGPAGYEEDVAVIIHPEGLWPGGPYHGQVHLFSSAPGGERTVDVSLLVGGCTYSYECSDGWVCNAAIGYCEPPLPCDVHEDCSIGSYCPQGGGLCESSGVCGSDSDCPTWLDEAMVCNLARESCEPALCVGDADCSIGSYCNEQVGICLSSTSCTSDFDCWTDVFAFHCDVDYGSCAPVECAVDEDCPEASYCSEFWQSCAASALCDSDLDCFAVGMVCDETRGACEPE